MTLPNFIIIGAQKAGTTALYRYLNEHPDIYMAPDKEPRYFANLDDSKGVFPYRSLDEYITLYDGVKGESAIGEASTFYLYSKTAAQQIKNTIPDVKIIAILRNPVDRAYSAYVFRKREGQELRDDFDKVIDDELIAINSAGGESVYLERGMFSTQLKRYYDLFEEDNIKLYLYEDFVNKPQELLLDVYRFLGVSENSDVDTSRRYNISEIPKNAVTRNIVAFLGRQNKVRRYLRVLLPDKFYWRVLVPTVHRVIELLRTGDSEKPQPISEKSRKKLLNFYHKDIEGLNQLTGLDVQHWLK